MDESRGRWRNLVWLLFAPGMAAAAVVIQTVHTLITGEELTGLVPVAIGGAALGGALAVYATVISWRADDRLRAVRERHPGALVRSAADLSATGVALGMMFGSAPLGGRSYTVAFAADGMHVYAGRRLEPVVNVLWSDTLDVHEEFLREPFKSQSAIVVGVRLRAGAVGLPWGITDFGRPARPAEIARTRTAVEALRAAALAGGGGMLARAAHPSPVAPVRPVSLPGAPAGPPAAFSAPASAWPGSTGGPVGGTGMGRHRLRPGLSSRAWVRLAIVPGIVSAVVVVVTLAVRLGTAAPGGALAVILPGLVVAAMALISLGMVALSNVAARHEVAAGYTLTRLGPVTVDQVDPRTGFVLRRAGHPQLSKEQEAAQRARVRAIDPR